MRGLALRVGFGNLGTGLSIAKPQLPEQSLALSGSQIDAEALPQTRRESFSIPEIGFQTRCARRIAQEFAHFPELLICKARFASTPRGFHQRFKPITFEAVDPIFHCVR